MELTDVSIDTIVALAKQKQTKWCSVPKSINCEAGKEAFRLHQYILYVYVYEDLVLIKVLRQEKGHDD